MVGERSGLIANREGKTATTQKIALLELASGRLLNRP
jgi:hypothetical protein